MTKAKDIERAVVELRTLQIANEMRMRLEGGGATFATISMLLPGSNNSLMVHIQSPQAIATLKVVALDCAKELEILGVTDV